jgi:hypothetical protein
MCRWIWREWTSLFTTAPARLSLPMHGGTIEQRTFLTYFDDMHKIGKKRVIAVRPVESMITIRPAADELKCHQSAEFLLNGRKREPAHLH